MTRTRLGATSVTDPNGRLAGYFTDGDFRRLAPQDPLILQKKMKNVMTLRPHVVTVSAFDGTARVEIDLPHARSAVEPGALVEHTAVEDEALSERVGIVRPAADDLDAVRRNVGLRKGNGRRRSTARRGEREEPDERGGENGAGQRPRTVRTAKRAVARPWRT